MTYWNATVAARLGAAVSAGGECGGGAAPCGGFVGAKCPGAATCNFKVPDSSVCSAADASGTCWALPLVCKPGTGFGPLTRACGASSCMDECTLIGMNVPWYGDSSCPQ